MTLKVLMVDPPSGWLYGFPKPYPGGALVSYKDKVKWFLENDYPQELIDEGMLQYCRFEEMELDDPIEPV